jgi:K+-sensing histidine kinase KdpD
VSNIWNVVWPFEHYIFKRRINLYLVQQLKKDHEMIADWKLYELVLFNILQNSFKFNKIFDGDVVITLKCKPVKKTVEN